jgi:hypothetical protein
VAVATLAQDYAELLLGEAAAAREHAQSLAAAAAQASSQREAITRLEALRSAAERRAEADRVALNAQLSLATAAARSSDEAAERLRAEALSWKTRALEAESRALRSQQEVLALRAEIDGLRVALRAARLRVSRACDPNVRQADRAADDALHRPVAHPVVASPPPPAKSPLRAQLESLEEQVRTLRTAVAHSIQAARPVESSAAASARARDSAAMDASFALRDHLRSPSRR